MSNAQTTVHQKVKDFILKEFLPGESPENLTDDTPLVTGGILDSLATLKLVAFLEETQGIKVEAHEMGADNFDSVNTIAAYVGSKSEAAG